MIFISRKMGDLFHAIFSKTWIKNLSYLPWLGLLLVLQKGRLSGSSLWGDSFKMSFKCFPKKKQNTTTSFWIFFSCVLQTLWTFSSQWTLLGVTGFKFAWSLWVPAHMSFMLSPVSLSREQGHSNRSTRYHSPEIEHWCSGVCTCHIQISPSAFSFIAVCSRIKDDM